MKNIFTGNYKAYLIVPLVLTIAFLALILIAPGLQQGLDLKGGTQIIIKTDKIDPVELETLLSQKFTLQELRVEQIGNGVRIEYAQHTILNQAKEALNLAVTAETSQLKREKAQETLTLLKPLLAVNIPTTASDEQAVDIANNAYLDAKENFEANIQSTIKETFNLPDELAFTKRDVGAKLGPTFWENAIKVGIIAMILVIIVIFIFFREIVPSLGVIAAAIFDMLGALAGMALFGIALNLATIPALLMLIGYSVDTDIMLTTRILKQREGTAAERTHEAMKTGLTMTITTLVALSSMVALSYWFQLGVIFEISTVLFFGLLADLVSTWFMNAPLLLWYKERRTHHD
jgi:preprotein translocase subunit SecF